MKKRYVWIGVPLIVALLAIGYQYLPEGEQDPDMSAEPELGFSAMPEPLADRQRLAAEQKTETGSVVAPEQRPLERESETKGDRTHFSMTYGDIGYVDVNSIMRDRNPYSIVDLLQTHRDLTGADDSLEIKIEHISENEIWGQEVVFRQVIDGQPLRQAGTVFFSPDGAVTWITGYIVRSRSRNENEGNVLILAHEAETIAREAAVRYAATLERPNPEWADLPVEYTVHSVEMDYDLNADNRLEQFWNVAISISGPTSSDLRILVAPDTGKIMRMDEMLVNQTSYGYYVIVCDAAKANDKNGKPTTNGINGQARQCDTRNTEGSPATVSVGSDCRIDPTGRLCKQSQYADPTQAVRDVISESRSLSPRSVANPINIIVNHPELPGKKDAIGDWSENYKTIRIEAGADAELVAIHETFHAITKSPTYGVVEHGLVYGMTAIYTGESDHWYYEGKYVKNEKANYSGGALVTHTIYRISQKVTRGQALELILDVDRDHRPASIDDFVTALQTEAKKLGISTKVNQVLSDLGLITASTSTPTTPIIYGPVVYGTNPSDEVYLYSDLYCRDFLETIYVPWNQIIDRDRLQFLGAASFKRGNTNVCETVDTIRWIRPRRRD